MKLIDDVGYPESLSELSLSTDFDGGELINKKGKRTAGDREIISEDSPTASTVFDFKLAKLKHQVLPEPKVS